MRKLLLAWGTLFFIPILAGCTLNNVQSVKIESEKSQFLEPGEANYTFAAMNRGHAFYSLKPRGGLSESLKGYERFKILATDTKGHEESSNWISVSGFLTGKDSVVLNTGFMPEECKQNNDKSHITLSIYTDAGMVNTQDFTAPNNCSIDSFNLPLNGK